MKTKHFKLLFVAVLALIMCFALAACDGTPAIDDDLSTIADAAGIATITKTDSDGLVDTWTVTFNDGSTCAFTVTNGAEGEDGAQGIQGVQGVKGADGITPTVEIDENGFWVINGILSEVNAKGVKGDKGDKGDPGIVGPAGPAGLSGNPGADGASVYVAYSADADGTDYTATWSTGQCYIGFCSSTTEPDDKTDYVWSRYIQSETAYMTVSYAGEKTYFASLSEALTSANSIAKGVYTAQKVYVLSGTTVIPADETVTIGKYVTVNVFPSAEIVNRGTIAFLSGSSSGSNYIYLDGTLINYGTISMPKYNKVYANAYSSIVNDGTINMGDTTTKSWSGLVIRQNAVLNNFATIISSGTLDVYGTLNERIGSSSITSYGYLYARDGGYLNAESGSITIKAGTFKLLSGSKFTKPTASALTIDEGANFNVESAVTIPSSPLTSLANTVNNGTATLKVDSYDAFKSFQYFDNITMTLVNDIQYVNSGKVNDLIINCLSYDVTFTLDLNGFDLKNGLCLDAVKDATTAYDHVFDVTIKDTSAGDKGTVGCSGTEYTYSSDTACIYGIMIEGFDNVNLTLDNVNVVGRIAGLYTNGTYGGTSMITATNCTFSGNPESAGHAGAYLASNFTYAFTSCTFEGDTGLYVKAGTYTIKDCIITANGAYVEPSYNANGANLTGDAFVIDICEALAVDNRVLNVTIDGGTITSENGSAIAVIQTYASAAVDYAVLNGAEGTVFYDTFGVETLTNIKLGNFYWDTTLGGWREEALFG